MKEIPAEISKWALHRTASAPSPSESAFMSRWRPARVPRTSTAPHFPGIPPPRQSEEAAHRSGMGGKRRSEATWGGAVRCKGDTHIIEDINELLLLWGLQRPGSRRVLAQGVVVFIRVVVEAHAKPTFRANCWPGGERGQEGPAQPLKRGMSGRSPAWVGTDQGSS